VFAFFTDPAKMVRWKGTEATLDPRQGGIYRVNINGRDVARGEFVEIVPHSRLVFTWGWEGEGHPIPPGSSTVEVVFVPDGDGTIVRLIHRDLPDAALGDHGDGWDHYLSRLAIAAAGGDPGADPWVTSPTQQATASG
jgi:uncharacterized protein YndB with AHSA1/START domain